MIFEPDDLFSLINKHICFGTHHGPQKDQNIPFVSRRIYVIQDNLKVLSEAPEHDSGEISPVLIATPIDDTQPGKISP